MIYIVVLFIFFSGCDEAETKRFLPSNDLLSLHYDHAPDKDDGHSAAADRTILESMFGIEWIRNHVVAVSGAYGKNAATFNEQSNTVMDAAWNDGGGWLNAHADWDEAVTALTKRWLEVLNSGGYVWVKEGGQSDLTADVVKQINRHFPAIDTAKKIHLVQHGELNEEQTSTDALKYVRTHTHYIKINNANTYLSKEDFDPVFVKAASEHPLFGQIWQAAFAYYSPRKRLDFSDTGELMYILGLGEMGVDDFRHRFFAFATDP